MKFNLSGINRLKPGAIRLRKLPDPRSSRQTFNLMQAIKNFGRRMDMRTIPATTVEKLRTDPYFKYCFVPIIQYHPSLYTSDFKIKLRNRMHDLLLNPDLANEKDIYDGLVSYMNNLPTGKMPGGFLRMWAEREPDFWVEEIKLFNDIDKLLKAEGKWEKAASLKDAAEKEDKQTPPSYTARLEYFKLCLDIFNKLVNEYGYNPRVLWT